MELSRYQHVSSTREEGGLLWVNYSLTLTGVQARDNGTTYQCILDPFDLLERFHSNTETLIVNGEIPIYQSGVHGYVYQWYHKMVVYNYNFITMTG